MCSREDYREWCTDIFFVINVIKTVVPFYSFSFCIYIKGSKGKRIKKETLFSTGMSLKLRYLHLIAIALSEENIKR